MKGGKKPMAEKIHQTDIEREKGYLYYVKDVDGKLAIFKAKMARGGKKEKKED